MQAFLIGTDGEPMIDKAVGFHWFQNTFGVNVNDMIGQIGWMVDTKVFIQIDGCTVADHGVTIRTKLGNVERGGSEHNITRMPTQVTGGFKQQFPTRAIGIIALESTGITIGTPQGITDGILCHGRPHITQTNNDGQNSTSSGHGNNVLQQLATILRTTACALFLEVSTTILIVMTSILECAQNRGGTIPIFLGLVSGLFQVTMSLVLSVSSITQQVVLSSITSISISLEVTAR
mmetsp:Transcript_28962/g.60563  ORF Transcript_28962/g.60563 Transcript_28962/m.60563 type:complete len:234 (-) Transcript_28962:899-1600(-)